MHPFSLAFVCAVKGISVGTKIASTLSTLSTML
nr:MAG TPA_asm: hypothetical protein [Caudoviricetes sp.]